MREHAVLLKEISDYLDAMPDNTDVGPKILATEFAARYDQPSLDRPDEDAPHVAEVRNPASKQNQPRGQTASGDEVARRLSTIPGIGPVGATAFAASVADPRQFRSGREFAA